MEKFILKDSLAMHFTTELDRDFYIQEIGYHDFHSIEPLKVTRIQRHYTIHLVLGGQGYVFLNNKKYDVSEGSLFYIPPNVNLCYYPDDTTPWKYVWFSLNGEKTSEYAQLCNLSTSNPITRCTEYPLLSRETNFLLSKLEKKGRLGYYETLSMFYKLVDLQMSSQIARSNNLEDLAITYIDLHFHEIDFSIDQMCHELHISHSYLCKIFKQKWLKSPKQYLIEVRIKAAKNLLLTTSLTIHETAYSVGYYDEIHFMKTFKTMEGLTCKQYRQHYINSDFEIKNH